MADLKPCPFCGKAAVKVTVTEHEPYLGFGADFKYEYKKTTVGCETCEVYFVERRCLTFVTTDPRVDEKPAKRWNKRLTKAKPSTKSPSKKTKEDSHDRIRTRSPCGD